MNGGLCKGRKETFKSLCTAVCVRVGRAALNFFLSPSRELTERERGKGVAPISGVGSVSLLLAKLILLFFQSTHN